MNLEGVTTTIAKTTGATTLSDRDTLRSEKSPSWNWAVGNVKEQTTFYRFGAVFLGAKRDSS